MVSYYQREVGTIVDNNVIIIINDFWNWTLNWTLINKSGQQFFVLAQTQFSVSFRLDWGYHFLKLMVYI